MSSTESDKSRETILVSVTGPDGPGLTTNLLSMLDTAGAEVGDMEQIVIRGRLNLGILIRVPSGRDLLKDLLLYGWENGLQVHFEPVDPAPTPPKTTHAVTVLAPALSPADLAAATGAITSAGGNIDRILRLARTPVMAYEFLVVAADENKLTSLLLTTAAERSIDIAIQHDLLGRRNKRLVVLDVDQTLVQDEIVDLLAEQAGVSGQVAELTALAMAGEIDFVTSLRDRVRLLTGLDASALERARDQVRLTPGAATFIRTLRRLGMTTAIISGGFQFFTDHLADQLGIDHAFGNQLAIVDGRLTGELVGPIVDAKAKAVLLRQLANEAGIPLEQTVAVGDGANDRDMLAAAGLGIAFNAKPATKSAADAALTVPYLDAVLFLLGVSREQILASDAHYGTNTPTGDRSEYPMHRPGPEPTWLNH